MGANGPYHHISAPSAPSSCSVKGRHTGRSHTGTCRRRHWLEFQFSPATLQGLQGRYRVAGIPQHQEGPKNKDVRVLGDGVGKMEAL